MSDIAVKLTNVGKEYLLTHQRPTLIGDVLGRKTSEKFWALKNINLTIRKGEKVGIVGPNGAGKTTLLKIITGITSPTIGTPQINGKVVSLINLEAGFHPELTGEENIYMNGMLVGMSKAEIEKKYAKIVKFADIDKFIDAPFYTYSDGMKFRLAFAVATASECDILIMDEVFVSGDLEFQDRTFTLIKKIQKERKITTIISSHIGALVWGFSDIFFGLKKGRIRSVSKNEMRKLVKYQDKMWRKSTKLAA